MTTKTYTVGGLTVFAALGAIDFVETYALVWPHGGKVYESNPLAAVWLENYGWSGLAIFKAAATALFATAALMISRRRPRTAAVVVTGGCLLVLAVTIYSRNLLLRPDGAHGGKNIASARIIH